MIVFHLHLDANALELTLRKILSAFTISGVKNRL